ncbi:MAG TPA: ATP-binding protein [Candidatus Binatia bacterium]|nr:ATP-binding protein [Candidatus Binatia bacterium]
MQRKVKARAARVQALVGGAFSAVLLAVVTMHSLDWVGRTFPGFFLISNRVVASIALPDSEGARTTPFFQSQVVAVAGEPVSSAAEVYRIAAASAPGTPIRYDFRRHDGEVFSATVESRRFSALDYLVLFGAYLVTGLAFLATGLFVFLLKQNPASVGLLASTFTAGVFVITAGDLYGPHWFVRLHVLAESMLAPTFVHLALVFPTERFGAWRKRLLAALYGAFFAFAATYEAALSSPSAYTSMHLLASATHGAGAMTLIALVSWDLMSSRSALVRRRVAVVAVGTLSAFLLPGLLMAASALQEGQVALNLAAVTAGLFPVSLAYAIVKQDLFELDVLVRRALTYSIVVVVLAGIYFAVLSATGSLLATRPEIARSPATLAVLNLALVLLAVPIRERVQKGVDRVFFRSAYVAETALSDLSQTLVTAQTLEEVDARTRRALGGTVCPTSFHVLGWAADGSVHAIPASDEVPGLRLPPGFIRRLERGEALARYEWDDGSGRPLPEFWSRSSVEILLPVGSGAPLAALALGRKASGRTYDVNDLSFLRTVASQVALAMTNAGAFARLADLNANLEREVRERTASLEKANTDLAVSLRELQGAYAQLERNQASLVRAERLATLGRLAAGIAHEVNTPLGAVMNTLRLVSDLSREYAESIDDASVSPDDHREIARELEQASAAAMSFARKAAGFISKVRMHGRDARPSDQVEFMLATTLAETGALVAHRLRLSGCSLDVAIDDAIAVRGSPGMLSQVLINLVTNAIDAYEDARIDDGAIEIRARRERGTIAITVRDRAGGIPPDVLPHVFDELFTTKEPGRGTGLGLWIARNLIEQNFGGTLTVEVEHGVGSCFRIALPEAGDDAATADRDDVAVAKGEGAAAG